jgi:hypothetical protein
MKKILILLFAILYAITVFPQRQEIDSIYSVMSNNYGLLNKWKSIYTSSADKLTDTIKIYEYSKSGDYYFRNGGVINAYYPNGKLKVESKWASGSNFNYSNVNEDYEYEYNLKGKISTKQTMTFRDGQRIPIYVSTYYYTDERLDSIIETRLNTETSEWKNLSKDIYSYHDNGYEIITSDWIYELNKFVETYKSECQLEDNRVLKKIYYIKNQQDWSYRFHEDYQYTENGYNIIDVEKSGYYSKYEYSFDSTNTLIYENLFFWNSNLEYWSLDFQREYTYYYKSKTNLTLIDKVPDINFEIYNGHIKIISENDIRCRITQLNGISHTINKTEFNLSKGIYIITITTSNGYIVTKKIII